MLDQILNFYLHLYHLYISVAHGVINNERNKKRDKKILYFIYLLIKLEKHGVEGTVSEVTMGQELFGSQPPISK